MNFLPFLYTRYPITISFTFYLTIVSFTNFKDDVMHVIMKIRVPLLRVKSDYQLTGKVGEELVRGNGKFNGNFSKYTLRFVERFNETLKTILLLTEFYYIRISDLILISLAFVTIN